MPYMREFFQEKLQVPIEFFNPVRNVAIANEADARTDCAVGSSSRRTRWSGFARGRELSNGIKSAAGQRRPGP